MCGMLSEKSTDWVVIVFSVPPLQDIAWEVIDKDWNWMKLNEIKHLNTSLVQPIQPLWEQVQWWNTVHREITELSHQLQSIDRESDVWNREFDSSHWPVSDNQWTWLETEEETENYSKIRLEEASEHYSVTIRRETCLKRRRAVDCDWEKRETHLMPIIDKHERDYSHLNNAKYLKYLNLQRQREWHIHTER